MYGDREINATLNKIPQRILNILQSESMVQAFKKWIRKERIYPRIHSMTAWGVNNYDFQIEIEDTSFYVGFDSKISGEPRQVYVTETGPLRVKTLALAIDCYERLIHTPLGEIIEVTFL
jgi:hypothetical protein